MAFCQTYSLLLLIILFSSCTGTRKLKENQILYGGGKVVIKSDIDKHEKKDIHEHLISTLRPKENAKFLWMRIGLSIHNTVKEPKSEKGFRYWLKYKLGKPPVLYDSTFNAKMSASLANTMFHRGFFEAKSSYTSARKKKIVKVVYNVDTGLPHRIDSIKFPEGSSQLLKVINAEKKNSLLKIGKTYNLDLLKSERERIAEVLRNNGFYFFENDFLYFRADSSSLDHKVRLGLNIKPRIAQSSLMPYTLGNIFVTDDFSLGSKTKRDTILIQGYSYLTASHKIRPEIVANQITIKKDQPYSNDDQIMTISNLSALGNYKYVNIQYVNENQDTKTIDAKIYLTPKEKYSLSAELNTATKSNNFFGPGARFSFLNRNIFHGSEILNTSLYGSYEWQISEQNPTGITSIDIGLESSLVIPRIILFKQRKEQRKYLGNTRATVGLNYFNRVKLYKFLTFGTGFKYSWMKRPRITHEFSPIDVSLTNLIESSDEFDDYLNRNPSIRRSMEEQFIVGMAYNFTYNAMNDKNFLYSGGIDLAGNGLSLINSISPGNTDPNEPKKFMGVPFSQFVRFKNELRYQIPLGKESKIATRLIASVGIPYGNSSVLPYVRQFFAGGSNSVRAFRSRSIGPGSYFPTDTTSFFLVDQSGDIRLEANIEYRFPIVKYLKGAFFVDAGNVWLINEDASRPGGKFEFDKFYKELAVGVGYGLRVDVDIIVIRFDWAFPIYIPYQSEGERINDIDFLSSSWRRRNIILNISLGYPF